MENIKAQLNLNVLQYGNFILFENEAKPVEGFILSPKGEFVRFEDKEVPIEACGPILLTPQWLYNFGFVKNGGFYFKDTFCLDENYVLRTEKRETFIPFVHILQNLYYKWTDDPLTIFKENQGILSSSGKKKSRAAVKV